MKIQNRCLASPRPVKFDLVDDRFLQRASYETDLSISDLMRKSVKLLRQQHRISRNWSFIMQLR